MRTVLRSALAAAFVSMTLAGPALAAANTDTTDLTFAADEIGEDACQDLRLAYSTGSYRGGCSDATFGGYLGATEPVAFPVADGLPLTLDPERPIEMEILTGTWIGGSPVGPIGDETMTITVTGKLVNSNKTVAIGSASQTAPAADRLRNGEKTYSFSIDPDGNTAGQYKSITVSVATGGSLLGGYTDTAGASFATFPIVDGTAPADPDEFE